mmetsp:Transcript_1233/g.1558  ORF Transcript_1233/g.1558 Transcript_1233/m.1558 type:complete len:86 (-) Transcript_1233:1426-1683(-)
MEKKSSSIRYPTEKTIEKKLIEERLEIMERAKKNEQNKKSKEEDWYHLIMKNYVAEEKKRQRCYVEGISHNTKSGRILDKSTKAQ